MEYSPKISEKNSVQKPALNYLKQETVKYDTETYTLKWEVITEKQKDKLNELRTSETQIILEPIFKQQIKKLNPFLTDEEIDNLLRQLNALSPSIQGNYEAWKYLRGEKSFYSSKEKKYINIRFIDTENISNNTFHAIEEFTITNGKYRNRFDIVFFINGIPVIFQENKNPKKDNAIDKGIGQVKRYHEESKEILKLLQAFVITNNLHFSYGPTWFSSIKDTYNYREEQEGDYKRLIESFFDRQRTIKLILDYVQFLYKDNQLQKVILKPHQIRAVEKIIQRAEEEDKYRGLIWHTQGSGKTLTMITAAKLIMENPKFQNPTILMIVDRNELEQQLFKNIESVELKAKMAESKKDLEARLREDYRGLIISTIHKFDDFPPNLNTRKNIFVFIDEAHRTTGGDLGNHLMGALPNATIIGFTGTPRATGKANTFLTFGKDDENLYLDKYSIAESIKDGTTLRLHYTHGPNEYLINQETLEKDLEALKNKADDIETLDKAIENLSSKIILEDEKRIEEIAKVISKHFRENVEPNGYKAFVVAVSRKACVLYKKALDKYLPPEYSKVVISPYYNDDKELKEHHLDPEQERQVRENFKDPNKLPKILIVTDKLLTGFDAPILYCLYLDKIMRDHVLLQTIARVNRPYEKDGLKKPAGLIVDFVGILSDLKKALEFDSKDLSEIAQAIQDIEKLKEEFVELIENAKPVIKYLEIIKPENRLQAIGDYFRADENKYHEFKNLYRKIKDIYDILSPDPFLSPYLDEFEKLTEIYQVAKSWFEPSLPAEKELSEKVKQLIYKHSSVRMDFISEEIYEIDDKLIKRLKAGDDTINVYNLVKSLEKDLEEEEEKKPYVKPLKEKLQDLKERYNLRQIETHQMLEELKQLIEDKLNFEKEEKDPVLQTIEYDLKDFPEIKNPENVAKEIFNALNDFKNWRVSENQRRDLKKELYKILSGNNIQDEIMIKIVEKILGHLMA
jgi:type I site-specific deoxyribonuclease, HsdR family